MISSCISVTHYPSLTTHCSSPQPSSFITHYASLVTHNPPLLTHYSTPVAHHLSFITYPRSQISTQRNSRQSFSRTVSPWEISVQNCCHIGRSCLMAWGEKAATIFFTIGVALGDPFVKAPPNWSQQRVAGMISLMA